MSEASASAKNIGRWFQADNARTLVTRPLHEAKVTMAYIARGYSDQDPAVVIPADDAFLVVLYLTDVEHSDIWRNRPPSPFKISQGTLCPMSLAQRAAIAVRGRFEALVIHLPRHRPVAGRLVAHIALALNAHTVYRYGRLRSTH